MNANAFISHRLFVAAIGHGARPPARGARADRPIDIGPGSAGKSRSAVAAGAGGAWTALAAAPLLTAAVANGLRSAGT
jgi:hypothetical protein